MTFDHIAPRGDGELFLTARQVCERYGKSHMWLHRKLRSDPDFPKPIYLGNDRHWRQSELQAYENNCRREPTKQRAPIKQARASA
jgi:predicted DNA-binding transcriptional regulator AlpA